MRENPQIVVIESRQNWGRPMCSLCFCCSRRQQAPRVRPPLPEGKKAASSGPFGRFPGLPHTRTISSEYSLLFKSKASPSAEVVRVWPGIVSFGR